MTTLQILIFISGLSFLFYGTSCLLSPYMRREFERYGLSDHRVLTGILEIAGAAGLFLGLVYPVLGAMAAGGLSILMLLGFLVRIKIKDGFVRSFPALFFMILNLYILYNILTLEKVIP
jgi:hypothetical protein